MAKTTKKKLPKQSRLSTISKPSKAKKAKKGKEEPFFKPVKKRKGAEAVLSILEELQSKTKEAEKQRAQAVQVMRKEKVEKRAGKGRERDILTPVRRAHEPAPETEIMSGELGGRPAIEKFGPEVLKERVSVSKIPRISTGIPGLDEMTNGGFEQKSIVLINGDPGGGKTIFALQFLYEGAKQGEAGVYISFGDEPRELLYPRMLQFGMDFQELEDKKLFFVIEYQPHEIAKLMQEEGGTIYDLITAYNVRRVVVDPISPYLIQFDTLYDARLALVRLFNVFRKFGATTLLMNEVSSTLAGQPSYTLAEFLADGVINLIHQRSPDGVQVRGIEIWKLAGIQHTEVTRPFAFTKKGITIYPSERLFISAGKK